MNTRSYFWISSYETAKLLQEIYMTWPYATCTLAHLIVWTCAYVWSMKKWLEKWRRRIHEHFKDQILWGQYLHEKCINRWKRFQVFSRLEKTLSICKEWVSQLQTSMATVSWLTFNVCINMKFEFTCLFQILCFVSSKGNWDHGISYHSFGRETINWGKRKMSVVQRGFRFSTT